MDEEDILRRHFSKLGRKGGPKGGRARMKLLSREERKQLARKAARARWARRKAAGEKGE